MERVFIGGCAIGVGVIVVSAFLLKARIAEPSQIEAARATPFKSDRSQVKDEMRPYLEGSRPLVIGDLSFLSKNIRTLDVRELNVLFDSVQNLEASLDGSVKVDYRGNTVYTPEDEARLSFYKALFTRYVRLDPEAGFARLGSLPEKLRFFTQKEFYSEWSKMDSDAAFESTLKITNVKDQKRLQSEVLNRLAVSDPEKAFNLAIEYDLTNSATDAMMNTFSREDPMSALEFIFDNNIKTGFRNAQTNLGSYLSKSDPSKAFEYLMQQPDSVPKQRILESLIKQWIKTQSEESIAALSQLSGSQYRYPYGAAAQAFVDKPEQGLAWLDTLPDDDNRKYATRSLINGWANNDIFGVSEWANSLPDGELRDTAVKNLVSKYRMDDPSYAMEWAYSMSNQEDRASLIKTTYDYWKKKEPEAAGQWIQSTDMVTDEQRRSWM